MCMLAFQDAEMCRTLTSEAEYVALGDTVK